VSEEQAKTILQQWSESAVYWEKHAHIVRAMFAPITNALIEAAGITEGQSVLDVAGGVGEPSLRIAELIGGYGSVIFTDAVEEMVTAAKREARRRKLTNIDFCGCLADSLPFSGDSFDVAVCRLGVMLFPDPSAAMREMLRVVKLNGPVSLAVWSPSAANPFFNVVTDVVSRYVASPPEDPDAPGAFRFAEHGKLARTLEAAGAIDVRERLLEFILEAPLTPKQFWEVRSELSDTLRAKLATLSSEQLDRIAREVEEAGLAFYSDGQMRFPAQVLIVTGRAKS
jgi:ubiquinone/menaquinone biosynthesis C-methylase UbiE